MMKKKKILITSFDMAIGGVERSLIGLLNKIDYNRYDVDLMLFKHEGNFSRYYQKNQIYYQKYLNTLHLENLLGKYCRRVIHLWGSSD